MPTISNMDLTAIIRRLEAATSRLEDMASSVVEHPGSAPTGPLPPPPTAAAARPVSEQPRAIPEAIPESVEEFDAFLTGTVKKYVNLSDELGGLVAEQVWHNGRV